MKFIQTYSDDKGFRQEVELDEFDTWGMDSTLSHIIVPMLEQLKATKHGAPHVDNEDVPEELHMPADYNWGHTGKTDENWFARWDYVLDQMIWAMTQIRDDKTWDVLAEGCKEHCEKIANGTRLFGKYYQALWD